MADDFITTLANRACACGSHDFLVCDTGDGWTSEQPATCQKCGTEYRQVVDIPTPNDHRERPKGDNWTFDVRLDLGTGFETRADVMAALKTVLEQVYNCSGSGYVKDSQGNVVGEWFMKDADGNLKPAWGSTGVGGA